LKKWQFIKWELVLAMVGLLGLGLWLGGGESLLYHYEDLKRPGAEIVPGSRVVNSRGVVEVLRVEGREPTLRLLFRNGHTSPPMTPDEFGNAFGDEALRDALASRNWLFAFLNITSWISLIWVTIGFAGQFVFSGRALVQWLVSEKERKSVVPAAYWWMSLCGGVVLFAYFGWRQDLVGILGQATGIVIYARNIRLLYKHRRRESQAQSEPD